MLLWLGDVRTLLSIRAIYVPKLKKSHKNHKYNELQLNIRLLLPMKCKIISTKIKIIYTNY